MTITSEDVAFAICRVNPEAGIDYRDSKASKSIEARAKRLIDCEYIVDGDPAGWGGGLVTVRCELRGYFPDCSPPLDYYGDYYMSIEASKHLRGHFIEWTNAAIALVYKD